MVSRVVSNCICNGYFMDPEEFTICLSASGDVYSVGSNENRAHGHCERYVFPLRKITSLKDIKSIACGDQHTVCLTFDGIVYTFGSNDAGQLGIQKKNRFKIGKKLKYTHEPQMLDLPPIEQVSCGNDFTVCLSEKLYVYSFGFNSHGQLGYDTKSNQSTAQRIELLENIEFIECGGTFTFCKSLNNDIYCWGRNEVGQLGIGNTNSQCIPVQCINWPGDIIDIKCGYSHTLILTSNQDVYSFGSNEYNQLGRETDDYYASSVEKISAITQIVRIECGYNHSMCLSTDNSLFVFGYNRYSQLGLEKLLNQKIPIQHPFFQNNVMDISKGGNHCFIKTVSNEIYGFGWNEYSQLGIKTDGILLTPSRVFEDNEDIWYSNINKSKAKSARF